MVTADTGTWKPLGSRATTQRERDIDDIFQAYPECTRSNLSIDDLGYVLRVLHNVGVQSRWLQIGQTLQINEGSLQAIKGDPSYCLLQVIVLWLRGQTRLRDQPSWWRVVWAVANEHGGNELRSAKIIAKKYKEMEGLSKFIPMTTHAKATSHTSLCIVPRLSMMYDHNTVHRVIVSSSRILVSDKKTASSDGSFCQFVIRASSTVNEGGGGVFEVSADAVDELYQDLTPAANRWMDIGVLLGVDYALLEQKRDEDKHQCLRETIKSWLNSLNDLTLQRLVEAVEHSAGGNYPAQAKLIMDKYRERTNSAEAGRPTSQIPAHDLPAPPKQVYAAEVPDGPPPHRQDSDQPAPPKQVHKIMHQESVPRRHSVYVERKEMTEKIRTALRRLKDIDGWVVVHGMAGFGKTVLAAEAVRDATFLQEVFPGGVFWLTVGQINDRSGELLSMIQRLIQKLDKDKDRQRPPNVEEAFDRLKDVMSEQHPRALLVLDDVWSEDVAAAFGVGCRTMVTSRFYAIATKVDFTKYYSVSVSEGFSEEEGRLLLSLWLNVLPDSLSPHANTILHYCRGSPLAIALIGAKLRKDPRDVMWKMVAEKLEKEHVGAIRLGGKLNEWKYKHLTINASIELSVNSLQPDCLKEYFEMFVVLEYDMQISCNAMATIWGTDDLDANDYLQDLIGYSLAQEGGHGIDFVIHDLILDFLKLTIPPQKQVELHQKVVQRYSEKCGGAFATLSPDDYVHSKLLSHVAAADKSDLLGDLMTNLAWLIASIQHSDPHTVLDNYHTYKSKVADQFHISVKQFEIFVSSHMDILTSNPQKDDIVQLALFLPDTNEIYCQAASLASGDRMKSWFEWSNKESNPEKDMLKLNMHRGCIMHCQYSCDGTQVVSCSTNAEVKVWDSSTGMELANFKGHKDVVQCCALSRSGKLVVSGSSDCTVKVWNMSPHKKRLLTEFTQHSTSVCYCDFFPDEKLVLSIDEHCVMVWEAQTGEVKEKWHESETIRYGAFASSGDCIVTATEMGTIRLWNPVGRLLATLDGSSGMTTCVVLRCDGLRLASVGLLENTMKIWSVKDCNCLQTLRNDMGVNCCDLSPDTRHLVTGDMKGYVTIWSVESGDMLQNLKLHSSSVHCVLYSPSGQHILSVDGIEGIIKVSLNEYKDKEKVDLAMTANYDLRFSASFEKTGTVFAPVILCYVSNERMLHLLRGSSIVKLLTLTDYNKAVSWRLSHNCCTIAVGYERCVLQVFSVTQSRKGEWMANEAWRKEGIHYGHVIEIYFSPDDSKIVSCDIEKHKVWSAATGSLLAEISVNLDIATILRRKTHSQCVFFNDSILVASAEKKSVLVWSIDTGITKLRYQKIEEDSFSIISIKLSQDNSCLVALWVEGYISVWDTQKGMLLMTSTVNPTSCYDLSPKGDLVAAGFYGGDVRIWNVSTGTEVAHIMHTATQMHDITFLPDGQGIITLCTNSIEWWDTNYKHSKTLFLKGTRAEQLQFSPDFQTIVTIDREGRLYVLTPFTSRGNSD